MRRSKSPPPFSLPSDKERAEKREENRTLSREIRMSSTSSLGGGETAPGG